MKWDLVDQATDQELQRFWSKVRKTPTCWIWLPGGQRYGSFWYRGYQYGAHRFAYTLVNGPVNPSLVIDHICGNHLCVNPEHLEPVTLEENSQRSDRGRRQQPYCKRGHSMSGYNVMIMQNKIAGHKPRRACRACRNERGRIYRQKRSLERPTIDDDQRSWKLFWKKVEQRADGHWIWRGAHTASGYANFGWQGKTVYSHKLLFSLKYGSSEDIVLKNQCGIKDCVRPEHWCKA